VTWTKISDDFADDCWTLSDAAFRLHVEGLTWSNRKFAKHPEVATELVASGWWTDRGEYYDIQHHASYQRPREDVLRQQARSAENGRKGGRPPKVQREIVDHARNPVANPVANPQGQDRTGSVQGSTSVEEEQEVPEQVSVVEEVIGHDDDSADAEFFRRAG